MPDGRKCGFRIFRKIHGVELDEALVSQLITEGSTDEMPMVNHSGQTKDITYTCTSMVGRRLLQYDLKYIGRDVRWELYKIGEM